MKKIFRKSVAVCICLTVVATSVIMNGLISFRATADASEWDYSMEVSAGQSVTGLDDNFTAYTFEGVNSATPTVTSNKASDIFKTTHNNACGKGYLQAKAFSNVTSNYNYRVLTYNVKSYKNFYAEYDFCFGYNMVGFMFGTDKGQFAFSLDNNSANDSGVLLYAENNYSGVFNLGGNFDKSSFTYPDNYSGNSTTQEQFNGTTNIRRWYMGENPVGGKDPANLTVDNTNNPASDSAKYTMCVKVENGLLTVWLGGHSDRVYTAKLNNYNGGYLSIVQFKACQGSIRGFRVKGLPDTEEWTYKLEVNASKEVAGLDTDYAAYTFEGINTASPTVTMDKASDIFKTTYNNACGKGYLQAKSLPSDKRNNNNYRALTLTSKKFKNFYAEYDFYFGYEMVGLMLNSEKGKFAFSLDSDPTNDTGIVLYAENNYSGVFNLGGNFDKESFTYPDNYSGSSTVQEQFNGTTSIRRWYMGENPIDGKDPANLKVDNTNNPAADDAMQTMCVKVQNGLLTAWLGGHSDRVYTAKLNNYNGGYISIVQFKTCQGSVRGLRVRDLGNWDYDLTVEEKQSLLGLSDDFDAYQFKGIDSATPEVTKGEATTMWTTNGTSAGKGYLQAIEPDYADKSGNNWTALTYSKRTYHDFYAEYDMYYGGGILGLMFGADEGKFALSKDKNSNNDTGAIVYSENNCGGVINIGGGVNTSTFKYPDNYTGGSSTQAAFVNTSNIRRWYMTADITDGKDPASLASGNGAPYYTICVAVENDLLSIWMKGYTERVYSIRLNNYEGGKVSLVQAPDLNWAVNLGAFKGFRIRSLDSDEDGAFDYGFTIQKDQTDITALDAHFKNYRYDAVGAVTSATKDGGKPSNVMTTASTWANKGYLAFKNDATYLDATKNSGMGTLYNGSYDGLVTMTYTDKEFNDFVAEYQVYPCSTNNDGILGGITFGSKLDNLGIGTNKSDTGFLVSVTAGGKIIMAGKCENATYVSGNTTGNVTYDQYLSAVKALDSRRASGIVTPSITNAKGSVCTYSSPYYTIVVRVSDGKLKVYSKDCPQNYVTLDLSNYSGGYVSLFSVSTCVAFRSFKIKELASSSIADPDFTDADTSFKINVGQSIGTALDKDYAVYSYDKDGKVLAKDGLPSKQMTLFSGKLNGNYYDNDGALKFKPDSTYFKMSDGRALGASYVGTTTLTYKTKSYKDFHAEYSVYPTSLNKDGMIGGLVFGSKLDNLGISTKGLTDGSDSSVMVALTSSQKLILAGAVGYGSRPTQTVNGVSVDNPSSYDQYLSQFKDILHSKLYLYESGKENEIISPNGNNKNNANLTKDSRYFTLVVEVKDNLLTVYEKSNPEVVAKLILPKTYAGGYISLFANSACVSFKSFGIKDLSSEATGTPITVDGFDTINDIKTDYTPYYLSDAADGATLTPTDYSRWYLNSEGFLSRTSTATGGNERADVDVLTYNKSLTDYEIEFDYQQSFSRTGFILGGQKGKYPFSIKKTETSSVYNKEGGILFYLEAEGNCNAMGDFVNGYTETNVLRRRTSGSDRPDGFLTEGSAMPNYTAKKVHHVKIVVKNKEVFVFVDGSSEYNFYLKLPSTYNGGYISFFSACSNSGSSARGVNCLKINETVTTEIPTASGATTIGNRYTNTFEKQKTDFSAFTAYHLGNTVGGKIANDGKLTEVNFYDDWMIDSKKITRTGSTARSSQEISNIAVLTYNKRLTDFSFTYEYQKTPARLMAIFGAEKGQYPLKNAGATPNSGVLVYPEYNFGTVNGGIIARGELKQSTASYRSEYRLLPIIPTYHTYTGKNWATADDVDFDTWHTLKITVVNKHCYIFIDNYGIVSEFDLPDSYDGGYVSLASASSNRSGYRNLEIVDLSNTSSQIKSVENPRDITVKTGNTNVALPSAVAVTNKAGTTANVRVNWDLSGVDFATEGTYTVYAKPILPSGFTNEAGVPIKANIRVKNSIPENSAATAQWTFDTNDDMRDFSQYYISDAYKSPKAVEDTAGWLIKNGKLLSEQYYSANGNVSTQNAQSVKILTYNAQQYTNFEVEVDYTQMFSRVGVLFGSKQPGQFIDYVNIHNENDPILAFVEYEGKCNLYGNVVNTDYYSRTDKTVSSARQNYCYVNGYHYKGAGTKLIGTMHHMKLRVVGTTVTMWIDDVTDPFVTTISDNYKGGYISLLCTNKEGVFDNFKITRLGASGKPVSGETRIAANGKVNITIDQTAPTEIENIETDKPTDKKENNKKTDNKSETAFPWIPIAVAGAVIVLGGIIAIIVAKRRKSA